MNEIMKMHLFRYRFISYLLLSDLRPPARRKRVELVKTFIPYRGESLNVFPYRDFYFNKAPYVQYLRVSSRRRGIESKYCRTSHIKTFSPEVKNN